MAQSNGNRNVGSLEERRGWIDPPREPAIIHGDQRRGTPLGGELDLLLKWRSEGIDCSAPWDPPSGREDSVGTCCALFFAPPVRIHVWRVSLVTSKIKEHRTIPPSSPEGYRNPWSAPTLECYCVSDVGAATNRGDIARSEIEGKRHSIRNCGCDGHFLCAPSEPGKSGRTRGIRFRY